MNRSIQRRVRATTVRIARDEAAAGDAALAGLMFLARTLKEEELLTGAEIDELAAVLRRKLPPARHAEVEAVLLPDAASD